MSDENRYECKSQVYKTTITHYSSLPKNVWGNAQSEEQTVKNNLKELEIKAQESSYCLTWLFNWEHVEGHWFRGPLTFTKQHYGSTVLQQHQQLAKTRSLTSIQLLRLKSFAAATSAI